MNHAFKEFSLETERLEMVYENLSRKFGSIQQTIQEANTRVGGKLAELNFISRYLEAILNHMSQGILFIDLNGIVTTYNAAAQCILGIEENEFLFHPIEEKCDDQFFGFSLREAFASKKTPPSHSILLKNQGEIKEVEVESTFISMSNEHYPLDHKQSFLQPIQGLLLLFRDVTKLRQLQQLAYRADRLKELGELAAHLAHEIRNPLGGIKGFATILEKELKDRPDLKQMASSIVQGTDTLNQFVSHILEYARPYQVKLEKTPLKGLIEDLKTLLQADSLWNPNIHFMISGSDAINLAIDAQLMKAALLNLFVNAIQAMPMGGVLTVEIKKECSWIIIMVDDTGIGIAPENLAKIFSPFFTTKEKGTGLGLAEVQKVIQAHQGEISVTSQLGIGTHFIIKIPEV